MLVDSHCHLDFPNFADDLPGVVSRAEQAGVKTIVTICTRVRKFKQVAEIAEAYPNIFCSVGTHPHNADEELDITPDDLIEISKHPKVVGIGEAGLDYYYDNSPREAQAVGLRNHIAAARETGLPLIIHSRDADDDMISILEKETGKGSFPFILHCFSSGQKLADAGVALGGYVSFSGILTFKRSDELRDIASSIPHDRLLVETDAPYLAPMPHRGKTNEPSFVVHTAKQLADVLNIDSQTLNRVTTDNFFRLFSKNCPDAEFRCPGS